MAGALTITLLAALALAFVIWTVLMFRCLLRMRRLAVVTSGQAFPGLRATFAAWRVFLSSQEFSRDRNILFCVTALLLGLILLFTLTQP